MNNTTLLPKNSGRLSIFLPWAIVVLLFGALIFVSVVYKPFTPLQSFLQEYELLSTMRVNFLKTIEAGKSAVLATTDESSIAFAEQARQAAAKVESGRKELEALVVQANSSRDKQTMSDFNSCWSQFQTLNNTILELATQNTNIKAQKLSSTQCARDVKEIEANLNNIIQQRIKNNRNDNAVRIAYEALTASLNILALHKPHIEEAQDEEMDKIEKDINSYDKVARKALAALRTIPDLVDNDNLKAADEAYGRFMKQTAEVLKLSRMNTNVKSTELSWGKQSLISAQCEGLLTTLQDSVKSRQWGGTK